MDEELTTEDIERLIEACDAWLSLDDASGIMGDMVSAMLADRTEPDAKEKWQAERKRMEQERKQRRRTKERVVTILKAKLICLMAKMEVGEIKYGG